ncbi:hypothetical protein QVD17_24248 [Tagetes erecta]|uniref:Secreted protein n=1 Tax=Tagetes erecta TaxID=13708 RepID=A0AAD8NUM4_TARER|nr:hypothetical protein QVD17_24248 [Tagetes erecta]
MWWWWLAQIWCAGERRRDAAGGDVVAVGGGGVVVIGGCEQLRLKINVLRSTSPPPLIREQDVGEQVLSGRNGCGNIVELRCD